MTYTLTELRSMASEYLKALPRLNGDQVENGLKMFNIAYLNTRGPAYEMGLAVSLWDYVSRKAVEREAELLVEA